jgi:hypothetical protein
MRRILVTTALILAELAVAAPSLAAGARLPVRVVAPAPGTGLNAGALAAVEWEVPEGGLDRRIVEWEAFLSLDGGRTWPLRLTPHLDVGIRRFSFRVPGFPSRDARLLLRFGDEREETEVEVPGRFTISAGPDRLAHLIQDDPLPPALRLARGESARPGEGGVVVWTEGTRDGAGLRAVASRETDPEWQGVQAARSLLLPLLWPASGREDLPPPEAADLDGPSTAGERAPAETAAPRPAPATRVLIHRYNE